MKLIKSILDALVYIYNNLSFKDILIIVLSCLMLYFMISARHYKSESKFMTVVYEDTVSEYRNKLKEEYASKSMYMQTVDQLKKNNEELYSEIKSLKDNPVVITKTDIIIKLDTVYMENKEVDQYIRNDTTFYDLKWSTIHPDGFYSVSGLTSLTPVDINGFSTTLTSLNIPIKLTMDIIEQDNRFRIIGKTDNPYVNIIDYNSAFIDPTESKLIKKQFPKKRWAIGPQIGFGLTKDMHISPYIGLGITWGIVVF